uniref:SOGA coiled-coil domain-containing protein n=1 Tax=Timema bartmani TaxID=61472 RepID=A0A7R9F2P0_9NEOP|nr:unnamed protein product [Timema bartmani]
MIGEEELILASLGIRPEPDHSTLLGAGVRARIRYRPQTALGHDVQGCAVTRKYSTPSDSYTLRRRTTESSLPSEARRSPTPTSTFSRDEQPSQRHKKVTENTRSVKEDSCETGRQRLSKDTSTSSGKQRRLQIQSLKETRSIDEPTNPEVEFIIQVKSSNTKKSSKKDSVSGPNQSTPSVGTCKPYSSGNKRLTIPSYSGSGGSSSASGTSSEESYEEDSDNDDISSTAGTETTETTLIDRNENELQEQIESLKQELDMMRNRCERVEREKSDILLSRIASMHTAPSKTAASEVLKLQQKVNDLQTQSEDLLDEKKSLSLRVKELEDEVDSRPDNNTTKRTMDDLRSKLLAAENLCEELMDENEDMKKELQDLEEEIEELQDNFREEQADEYTTLKKELEQTAKNCRILSFKLRKAERKAEQMEAEKLEAEKKCREMAGGLAGLDKVEKIKQLEQDLALANETIPAFMFNVRDDPGLQVQSNVRDDHGLHVQSNVRNDHGLHVQGNVRNDHGLHVQSNVGVRLKKELEDVKEKLESKEYDSSNQKSLQPPKKKAPMLGSIGKTSSGEKVSRESLTRGGSQEDPVQLLRDLQDSLEREADLREQLRYAEEEVRIARYTEEEVRIARYTEEEVRIARYTEEEVRIARYTEEEVIITRSTKEVRIARYPEEEVIITRSRYSGPEAGYRRGGGAGNIKYAPNIYQVGGRLQLKLEALVELRMQLELYRALVQLAGYDFTSPRTTGNKAFSNEAAVLRKKVEELETENETMKRKVKDIQEKLNTKTARKTTIAQTKSNDSKSGSGLNGQKIKVLEDDVSELRKKLIEKERDCERLHSELTITQKRLSKGSLHKSKSLDSGNEQHNLDLKRQLQLIEQEAAILRTKIQILESDNDKLSAENKRLELLRGTKKGPTSLETQVDAELKGKIEEMETQLTDANKQITELQGKLETKETETKEKGLLSLTSKKFGSDTKDPEVTKLKKEIKLKTEEIEKVKTRVTKAENDNKSLTLTINRLKEETASNLIKFYKQRTPKKPTDFTTKLQLKKMVEELENEIGEVLVALKKSEEEKSKLPKDDSNNQTTEELKEANEKLTKDLQAAKTRLESLEKELKEQKEVRDKENDKFTIERKIADEGKKKINDDKKKLEDELKKRLEEVKNLNNVNEMLTKEKNNLEKELTKLGSEKASLSLKKDEMAVLVKKLEAIKDELEEEKRQNISLRKQVESGVKSEQEKNALNIEILEKITKISEVEKKLKETEDKLKKVEKTSSSNKGKVAKLEKELEEEREKVRLSESTQQEMTSGWLKERDNLKDQISEMQNKTRDLEKTIISKQQSIEKLEINLKDEKERVVDMSKNAASVERQENEALKEDLATNKAKLLEVTQKLQKVETLQKSSEEKYKKDEADLKKEKQSFESKVSQLETDLQAERKKMDRMKATQEKETKNREHELSSLRTKLRSLESNTGITSKKIQEEYQTKIEKLEEDLSREKQEYEDLTTKYEILEEEHVGTKSQLVKDKELVYSQLLSTKRELASMEGELKTLQDTYKSKQEVWIKEKLDMQERARELEEKVTRSVGGESWTAERNRLKSTLEEKTREVDNFRREIEMLNDQMDHIKKENDELRRKLEDFDKVVKIQRNMTADTSAIDKELRETKNKLLQEEKCRKTEVAQLKMRYDGRVALISEEIQGLQAQVSRFKRERDTFRHMLEGAQKTITDLKSSPRKVKESHLSTGSSNDEVSSWAWDVLSLVGTALARIGQEVVIPLPAFEMCLFRVIPEARFLTSPEGLTSLRERPAHSWKKEPREAEPDGRGKETRMKVASLEQQVSCMEDELSESRLEGSKLKTELISERSSWEVKMSEMQSRINELEEDRILTSGRSKIPGMRTRMELAWHKEREEQHRLLQETSTLARDLRQTLFEVERERDKERLEAKRRLDQLKKSTEEEQDENRKKVTELQCDLLELRDAHAKLRTTNEKLRREKERSEREREELRQQVASKKRTEQDEERKINLLLEQVDELMGMAPDLFIQKQKTSGLAAVTTPTPPRRFRGSKSRESSPGLEKKEFKKESSVDRNDQLRTTVQRLAEATDELKVYQRLSEEERDKERAKRALGFRR